MKTKIILAAALFFSLILSSCKKDTNSGGTQNSIQGNWKLISVSGISQVTDTYQQYGSAYKNISNYTYSSSTASGSYNITSTNFDGQSIAYNTTGTLTMKIYQDNNLLLDNSQSSQAAITATNSTSTYKKIGTDSLYFVSGSLINVSTGTSSSMTPAGMKYKIEGTKLTLSMDQTQSSIITQSGVSVNRLMHATATVTLQQ